MDKSHYIKTMEEIQTKLQELISDLQKTQEDDRLRILLAYQRLDAERIIKYLRMGGTQGRF